ncbi:MAG: NeuD/PglB/VioB family sugar acetyltransferase [Salibacteraceae bacterium]
MKAFALVGAGGHARTVISLLEQLDWPILGVFDNNYVADKDERIDGYALLGTEADLPADHPVIVCVGANERRAVACQRFESQLFTDTLFHPMSQSEPGAQYGRANQIMAQAFVSKTARLGNNNLIYTQSVIEHECVVGNDNFLATGAIVCGRVTIGDRCFIGAGSTIIDKITIGSDITIGAGATVVHDLTEPGVYLGTPAKRVQKSG